MITKVPWKNGYLVVEERVDHLTIKARNVGVDVKPRIVSVEGVCGHRTFEDRVEKVVYLCFKENVQPFLDTELSLVPMVSSKLFVLKHVKMFYGEYYSVKLPEYFHMNYIVLTNDEVAVSVPTKRQVYVKKDGDKYVAYIH